MVVCMEEPVYAKVKEVNPPVKACHCFLHKENLAVRGYEVIQVINFIRVTSLNKIIFSQLYLRNDSGTHVCYIS